MERLEWPDVLDRSYTFGTFDGVDGVIGLIRFNDVGKGMFRDYGGKTVTVYDKGCYWFQIAYNKKNRWLTALFYPDGTFAQAYFDVTEYNTVLPNGKSEFKDIYLDVVVMPDGTTYLLDEDELYDALKAGKISKEQYDEAYDEGRRIIAEYDGNATKLTDICTRCFNKLVLDIDRHNVHEMNLDDRYFDLIKSGRKTVELRLNDERRQAINAADIIEFRNRATGEKLRAKVNDIYTRSTVADLISVINPRDAGFTDDKEMTAALSSIYPAEKAEKYGYCAFVIKTA